jgi:GMP synthase (glutamine-hydrolysing)
MKKLYIIKTGTTFPDTLKQLGDFDAWTRASLGETATGIRILDVERGAPLPVAADCAGVVITGAHAMVTDNLPWSIALEKWIPSLLAAGIPLFGICYGHQLLARAAGGEVGFHPLGKEIGTVVVNRLDPAIEDSLFQGLPDSFPAHVTHAQTVLALPPGATRLAANRHEPNHAFRLGERAWGVQFHPEYSTDIMRAYIREQANELAVAVMDIATLLQTVIPTPAAGDLLRDFARLSAERLG